MKTKFFKLLGILFLASSVYAKDTYSLALVNMEMDYREYKDNGQILDSEQSNSILGLEFGYGMDLTCQDNSCANLEFKALVLKGDTDYIGSYIGSGQPYGSVRSTTSNLLYDLSIDWTQKDRYDSLRIMYGVGLGFHSWYRELSSAQNELYHWFYITPIVGLSSDITKELTIGLTLKYKYAVDPKMKANTISEDFKLGGVETFEVGVPVIYALNEDVEMFATYTYAKQKIKKSNVVAGYYEPNSTDNQQYVKLGVSFRY